MKTIKMLSIILLALFLIAGCKSSGDKTDMATAPNGTITVENWTWQAIATMNVGQGELKYNNRVYKFEIGGVGAGGVGVAKMSASGEVHNLKDIADFPGKYFHVKASGRATLEGTLFFLVIIQISMIRGRIAMKKSR